MGTALPVSDVAKHFFSEENVEFLHDRMRYDVYNATGMVIDRQSNEELLVVMRGTYFAEAKNLPGQTLSQVAELNGKVLDYCVDNIVGELEMRGKFLRDLNEPRDIMPHSVNANVKGHKSLSGMIR